MEIKIQSTETIRESARRFIENIGEHKVFAFYGKMGAGKTTFVKAICEELGVEDVITSPTFAIVNEYTTDHSPFTLHPSCVPSVASEQSSSAPFTLHPSPFTIYHFDFYRIKKLEEVYDMGYEDYFYSGALCFIEWPELIEELLPDDAVRVTIEENDDGTRTVRF